MNLPKIFSNITLKRSFDKIREWDGEARSSEEFDIGGAKWIIGIELKTINSDKRLHVFLCCVMDGVWISAVDNLEFTLLRNFNHDTKKFNTTNYLMTSDNSVGTSISSYSWSTILLSKYGYLANDKISFAISFDFIYQHFNKIENYTNMVMKIRNLELHLNKELLCASSEYFYNEIVVAREGNEKRLKSMISKAELGPFMLLLALMHPSLDVPAGKLASSLKLANRFKFNTIKSDSSSNRNEFFSKLSNSQESVQKMIENMRKAETEEEKLCTRLLKVEKLTLSEKFYIIRNLKLARKDLKFLKDDQLKKDLGDQVFNALRYQWHIEEDFGLKNYLIEMSRKNFISIDLWKYIAPLFKKGMRNDIIVIVKKLSTMTSNAIVMMIRETKRKNKQLDDY